MLSSPYNRFYHALLKEAHKTDLLVVDVDGLDFKFRPSHLKYDSFKQLMKAINTEYPIVGDKKVSTTKVSNKDLNLHIEWLINVMYANNYTVKRIEEEWSRLNARY